MKTRQGFVSNSSSSSFIVALPKNVKMKDVKKTLFGNEERFGHPYEDGKSYTTQEVAETVAGDMVGQTPNDVEAITKAIDGGWFDGFENLPGRPDHDFDFEKFKAMTQDEKEEHWRKESEETEARAKAIADLFIAKNKNKDIYVFSYADEDGSYGSALEHGGTFENVPHIRISYH